MEEIRLQKYLASSGIASRRKCEEYIENGLVKVNGKVYEVELEAVTENQATIQSEKNTDNIQPSASAEGTQVVSPMQGTILRIDVAVGDHVKKGQILMILEAMKLENEILAAQDGVVKEIKVTKGQTVNSKQVLLILG